jgi:hypothetical protein
MIYQVLLANGCTYLVDDDSFDGQHPDAFIGEFVDAYGYEPDGEIFRIRDRLIETVGQMHLA